MSCEYRSVENLIDGGDGAIPPVVARIFSGDSTSPLTREARMWCKARGLSFFCDGCGDREVRCNGRSKLTPLRKDQCDSAIPKPYKHTQTLTLRKARDSADVKAYKRIQTLALRKVGGIVRKISLMVGMGAIPPVVARIFSGDSTSPLTRDGHGCPKLNAQSFARMRNQQSVHMASVVVLFLG